MRVLVISDIHGNLPALEYVLKQENDSDIIISLGDVVNYGPWSNECVDLLDALKNKVLLQGNHEEAFISGNYPGNNAVAKSFFKFCYPLFARRDSIIKYIKKYTLGHFDLVHTIGEMYIFPDTEIKINRNTFIGHSHKIFSRKINGYSLINVGSIGQNRANIDELNYVLWQPEDNKIELITKVFNADILIKEMITRKYPEQCINYVQSKRAK
jgi:predicted phosphodiesterase